MLCTTTRFVAFSRTGLVAGLRVVSPRRHFFNFLQEQSEKTHAEKKLLKFSPETMYNVVSDIDRYKDFLPWCTDSKITSRKENVVTADLKIGFQIYEEKYTSKVELEKPRSVKVTSIDSSLFHYLVNTWEFLPGPTPDTCWTNFHITFKLKSALHSKLIEPVFEKATHALVSAFEKRASDLQQSKRK